MSPVDYIERYVLGATMLLLPQGMDSAAARAMLIAIGLQESRFLHRRQIGGPAHGFWQFEHGGGIRGVLQHRETRDHIRQILSSMAYDDASTTSYQAVCDNDVLACAYARLLLWTVPGPLPARGEADNAWQYYLAGWRPGKPHRATWDAFYLQAWA